MRGHGALIGAVDVSIGVEKGTSARTATVHKTNDGEEGENDYVNVDVAWS